MAAAGLFINLLEKHEVLTDKKTKKAEEKSIKKSDYVAPPGHNSFLKHGVIEDGISTSYLIFHNGVSWQHGRTWDFAEDWFCMEISWSSSSISTENLNHVQAFHVTSKSQGASMENCSTSLGYVLAAAADLSEPESDSFEVLVFGGQSTETAQTSNRLEIVTGPSDFDGALDCKAYRSGPRLYKEFKLPNEYSSDLDLIQSGCVPSSRCGHSLAKISSTLLVCTGGISIPRASKEKFHPRDSNIFILKYPQIEWVKLDRIEALDRTEHSMHIFDDKIYVIGGYSFRNHLASEIFPFNQVLEVELHRAEDGSEVFFSSSVRTINIDIMPDVGHPFLTSMCFAGDANSLYLYGGYSWPSYDPLKQNMFKFCPPYTNHNKRPKQESNLVIIDLVRMDIKVIQGSSEFATADGSLQILSKDDNGQIENLLIVGGTSERLDLYSTFDFSLTECNITPEYGGCVVTLGTRNKDTLSCSTPDCDNVVHIICDKYTRGLAKMTSNRYLCPMCADFDPVTKKKRPKAVSSRRGSRPRRT